jgi:hypothetical protein
MIRSRSGGFKFPDGTVQISASDGHSLDASDGAPVDALYVDTAGKVGIGTSLPGYPLTVNGTIHSSSGGFRFPDSTVLTTATGANIWDLNGSYAYYDGGNVGIGTSTPQDKLEVSDGIVTLDSGASASITGIRIREDDDLRWTILYRTWQDDDLEIFNEIYGGVAMIFKPDNKVGIGTQTPSHPFEVGTDSGNGNGAHVTAGGVWTNGSDRNSKRDFEPIDKRAVLAKVAELPITRWRYKGESDSIRHIGPVAQDFHAAFGLGESDRHIGTLDADGVALAAIQALHELLKEKDAQIATQGKRMAALTARLQRIEDLLEKQAGP